MNLMKLFERFGSDDKCRAYLTEIRWPDGPTCPRCEATKAISYVQTRRQFECESCGYQFSVLAGTIFHDTKLPLSKWFAAVYLMIESKKGMSANQMKRTLNVSYKTAWYLCHRIRAAMAAVPTERLTGIVEMDETFHGGKPRYSQPGWTAAQRSANSKATLDRKTVVMGAIQRGGPVRLRVAPDRSGTEIRAFAEDVLSPDTEAIYTDDWKVYRGLRDADTRHEHVNHTAKEWVRGDVHSNSIESVWSLFKRSVIGSYHHLSEKHLDVYLDEIEWRYNNRGNPFMFRDTMLALLKAETLPYATLVSGQEPA
jgi:transposase-like protein